MLKYNVSINLNTNNNKLINLSKSYGYSASICETYNIYFPKRTDCKKICHENMDIIL